MDTDAGKLGGSTLSRTRAALGLGFALALVAGLSASMLRVPEATITIACYAALANDLTPLFDPPVSGAVTSNAVCASP
jgi:hypothetical protein